MKLTLMTRRDCGLCDDMADVVRALAAEESLVLEIRDVDADADLCARYGSEVPVLLIEGRKAFKYRVTAAALRRRVHDERRRRGPNWWQRFMAGTR